MDITTGAGEGWSDDMELAPAHPGDAAAPDTAHPEGERLQTVLARAGNGSRRVVENMVDEGRIAVNGRTVTVQGMRVDPHRDRIAVDGGRLEVRDDPGTNPRNKPARVLTARSWAPSKSSSGTDAAALYTR
jgi:23S rRNA pseudouridine2605 synthase